ncbi:hypothetical protein QQ045_028895 [Rhodiola kirilowii]
MITRRDVCDNATYCYRTKKFNVLLKNETIKNINAYSNGFSGPLPELSQLKLLESLSLRDNTFTGPVDLLNLRALEVLNLSSNFFQGPLPDFTSSVVVDSVSNLNSFCLPKIEECDPRVNAMLLVLKSMDYPRKFARSWRGNYPCKDWFGISCSGENISIVNFERMGLNGTISPAFAQRFILRFILADNNFTCIIPEELTGPTGLI